MVLSLPVALLVLLAALLHAGWNALVKAGEDRLLTMALVIGVGAAGAALALPFVAPPAPASWPFLLLSAAIHIGYFFFLLQAYRVGDLSHVYPVARGAAPLLVAAGAALFAGESLSLGQLAGLILASLAIASFAFEGGWSGLREPGPFAFALAVALFISAYTVSDGLGVRASGSPAGFIAWLFVIDGFPLLLYALVVRRGRVGPYLRGHWRNGVIGGVMCAAAYALVIWALASSAMAFVSALRETSVVFAVLIGWLLLGESFGARRLAAAALVAAGIVVMNLAG
ncbi:MAG: EamA family transporter [Rhodospirillales bacterium]|nr:EamA family transporter [Rhodospirillales bacterium]